MTTLTIKSILHNLPGSEHSQKTLVPSQELIEISIANITSDVYTSQAIPLQETGDIKITDIWAKEQQKIDFVGENLAISKSQTVEVHLKSNFFDNNPIHIEASNYSIQPQFAAGYDLVKLNKLSTSNYFPRINNNKSSVVIIDTGVNLSHPMLAGRVVYSYDFSGSNDPDASALSGDDHGSHVSSIVARTTSANLIHLKVFPDNPTGASPADVEEALRWVVNNVNTFNIVSVNLSLGPSNNVQVATPEPLVGDEFQALVAQNVIPVVAGGNSYHQFNQPGVSSYAADPNAIGVGAVFQKNEGQKVWGSGAIDYTTAAGQITSFSQRHPELTDIFAPGAMITGASGTGVGTIDRAGTSQAAPYISGIAALAQDLAVQELGRRLSFQEFRELVRVTGTTIIDGDNENNTVRQTGAAYKLVDTYNLSLGIVSAKTGVLPTANIDTINGTANNDVIAGFGGNDILTGGAGADSFVFNSVSEGNDAIADFNSLQMDKVTITSSFGATSLSQFSFNGTTGSLTFNGQQFATLQNITSPDGFVISRDLVIEGVTVASASNSSWGTVV